MDNRKEGEMDMLKMDDTALVLIDVQGKLAKVMHESEALVKQITILIKGAQLLDIPIFWMEQYPKGLGPTTDEVKELLSREVPIDKMVFSACQSEAFQSKQSELKKTSYLVAGIEAHICVYQTVSELLEDGHHVEVVVDGISSRTEANKQVAIDKMQSLGAAVTSVEMALFELMRTAEHPNFKEISKLIK